MHHGLPAPRDHGRHILRAVIQVEQVRPAQARNALDGLVEPGLGLETLVLVGEDV